MWTSKYTYFIRPENLKKGAVPVNSDDIVDLIQQTNMLGKIGYGLYFLSLSCVQVNTFSALFRILSQKATC